MKTKINWYRLLYFVGMTALVVGAFDLLEGAPIILAGSALIALSRYLARGKHWKLFLIAFLMIAFGVAFLFYLSSLGGFGETSNLSWWWGFLILPYPLGWLIIVSVTIYNTTRKSREKINL